LSCLLSYSSMINGYEERQYCRLTACKLFYTGNK
jgi:hypothetical protein